VGCLVRCYYRKNGVIVSRAFTDENGDYEFANLTVGEEFFVVVNDIASVKEARVRDYILPDPPA